MHQAGLGRRQFGLTMILIEISALILSTPNIAQRYTNCTRISVREFLRHLEECCALVVSLLGHAAVPSMLFRT